MGLGGFVSHTGQLTAARPARYLGKDTKRAAKRLKNQKLDRFSVSGKATIVTGRHRVCGSLCDSREIATTPRFHDNLHKDSDVPQASETCVAVEMILPLPWDSRKHEVHGRCNR